LPDFHERFRMSLRRLLQLGIDVLITAILCLIPIGLAGWVLPTNPDGTVRPIAAIVLVGMALITCLALGCFYWVALPSSGVDRMLGGRGRTAGMRVFGLRVVSEDGRRASVTQLFVRWFGLLIDGMAFGLVGLVSIWLTRRGQRIGDLAAGTVVISQPRHVTLPTLPHRVPGRAHPGRRARAGSASDVPGRRTAPVDPADPDAHKRPGAGTGAAAARSVIADEPDGEPNSGSSTRSPAEEEDPSGRPVADHGRTGTATGSSGRTTPTDGGRGQSRRTTSRTRRRR
jgi:uncharacterized RDD family membrane protein YckC